ncbi:MAG: nucleotidyl transferase AbiEii/AbiGii toxin family protein [Candidatus Omnitrophota bacterium]
MIDKEFIRKLAARYHTTDFNILREYAQHLFLSLLYLQKGSDVMLFKGGTALRIIYNSPRFSEDLDFTAGKVSKSDIENLVQEVLVEIEKLGISLKIDEFSATSGGYIGFLSLYILDEAVSIELNISKRISAHKKGEVVLISSDFIPAYNLIQLPQKELVNEKIKALLERSKPRDFFDLYFILRSNLLPARQKGILSQVLGKLENKEYDFSRELKIFLPKSHQAVIKNFRAILIKEITR